MRGILMSMLITVACSSGGAAASGASGGGSSAKGGSAVALSLELAVTGTIAHFTLHNRGDAPLTVLTRVTGKEIHYDWFVVTVEHGGARRTLRFVDDRNRAGTEKVALAPGATWTGDADLAAWAARSVNGAAALSAGDATVRAVYEVQGVPDAWNGRLESAPVHARF
jgi:hypothetical protein